MEMIDAYVNRIKQVAMLLNYGEPQILELFKNTLPSRLYWVLFSINNLRDVVDAAKRVLTKEQIDRQLSGQSGATTPFMKIGDVLHSKNKTVSFNTQDLIREQLNSLTSMVYNMSIQKEENNRPFKPQIHQKRWKGQNWQNFGDTDRNRSFSRDRKRQNFIPNYRRHSLDRHTQMDMTTGKEAIEAKFMVLEMTVEIDAEIEYILKETSVMTEMIAEIGIGVEQKKEHWHLEEMTEDIIAQMQI